MKLFLTAVVIMGVLFFVDIAKMKKLQKQIDEQRNIIDEIKGVINGSRQADEQTS